jgi:hypothetical protein
VPAFVHHAGRFTAHGLGADRPLDDAANLQELVFECVSLLGDERGIRRDPIQDAGARGVAYLFKIRRVEKKIS